MQKILKSLTIVALFALPLVSFASIDGNIKYGASGSQVLEIQDFLFGKGYLAVQPTGYFFSLTLKAVKAYQADNSLPSTGFVGPLTRALINSELDSQTASSTEDEIEQTGTTTPIATTTPQLIFVPVQVETQTPVPQPTPTVVAPQAPIQTYCYDSNGQAHSCNVPDQTGSVSAPNVIGSPYAGCKIIDFQRFCPGSDDWNNLFPPATTTNK